MSAPTFGFDLEKRETEKETNSLENLNKFMYDEIRNVQNFESELILELKEVKHLEYNLRQLEIQMKAVEILTNKYKELSRNLYIEIDKTEVDLNKCKEYTQMIERVKAELFPMRRKIGVEAQRLYLQETHKLYSQSETERAKMEAIDKRARAITADVTMLTDQIDGMEGQYMRIREYMDKVEASRQGKTARKEITGFSS
jgi:L-rhamnose mutarotase